MMNDDTQEWLNDVSQSDYIYRLKQALREHKISQTKFAMFCHCSQSRISALLNKKYNEYVPKYIWKIAKNIMGKF